MERPSNTTVDSVVKFSNQQFEGFLPSEVYGSPANHLKMTLQVTAMSSKVAASGRGCMVFLEPVEEVR